MLHRCYLFLFFLGGFYAYAQISLNEVSNKNGNTLSDASRDYPDWAEIYNSSPNAISLQNFQLSDDRNYLNKWNFPDITIAANGFETILLSNNAQANIHHWESPVLAADSFAYWIPTAEPDTLWKYSGFSDPNWSQGQGYFSYGITNPLGTNLPTGTGLYMRKEFFLSDTSKIVSALAHIDYLHGFVVFLNGHPIIEKNLSASSLYNMPPYTIGFASVEGKHPTLFPIDNAIFKPFLQNGMNTLAVHIAGNGSICMGIDFSLGIKDNSHFWEESPSWMGLNYPVANFKLDNDGEGLYLSQNGILLDSIWVDGLSADYSLGRDVDGIGNWKVFPSPTPNASNTTLACDFGIEPSPTANLATGFYPNAISVSLQNTGNGIIHYTTNGNTPTLQDALYTGALNITQTTVLKARTFSTSNLQPSEVFSATYFIDEHIPAAVISLTVDSLDLWGVEGIVDNCWMDWAKGGEIAYFDSLHQHIFTQNVSVKLDGGVGARCGWQTPFRISGVDNTYGAGKFDYPLIPDNLLREKYETLGLRTAGNSGDFAPYLDGFAQRCTAGMQTYPQGYTPVVVFLNGKYWGVYGLKEKQDRYYFKHYENAHPDSLDIIAITSSPANNSYNWFKVSEGSAAGYFDMRSYLFTLSGQDPDFLRKADSVLDIKNAADYLIAETFFGNKDWLGNNIKLWRDRSGDRKWRYVVMDMESLGIDSASTHDGLDLVINMPGVAVWTWPISTLFASQEYRKYFINRYADVLNTWFRPTITLAKEARIHEQVSPLLWRHYMRWYSAIDSTQGAQLVQGAYDPLRQSIRDKLMLHPQETRDIVQDFFSAGNQVNISLETVPQGAGRIQINSIEPVGSIWGNAPWTGIYYDGVPVEIRVLANPGYTFTGWLPNTYTASQLQADTLTNLLITADQTFTAVFVGATTAQEGVKNKIEVFPNPAAEKFTLKLENPRGEEVEICLKDLQGRAILQETFQGSEFECKVEDVSPGIYFLQTRTQYTTSSQKIVIKKQ